MLKIGHRGAMGYEPENTLRSFRKAVLLKADAVELDVHIAASGEVVVLHDETMDRTTNGKGRVQDMSYEELKILDAGKGEKIPLLMEALDTLPLEIIVNIELKGDDTPGPCAEIIKEYVKREKGRQLSSFLVSSFDRRKLEEMKYFIPEIQIGVLFSSDPYSALDYARKISAWSLNLPKDLAGAKFISRVKTLGYKIIVWTVNDIDEINRFKALEVDGICSDYPDRI